MNVKGSAFRARLRYLAERGENALPRFLAALSPETRALVGAGFLVNGWYPFAAFVEMNTLIDQQLGQGDLALCYELGRYACDVNLTTLYRIFFRLGSVSFIIRRSAAAWRVNYDDGQMAVIAQGDDSAHLRIVGVPAPHRAHCLSVKGWMSRAVELSGGELVEQTERCRAAGDPECDFELSWRKATR